MEDEDVPEFVKPHFGIRILTGETLEDFTVEEMAEIFNEVFEEHISLSEVEDNHVEYDLAGNPMKTTASDEPKEKAPYDIRFDGDYIYASFLQTYGIDLFDVKVSFIGRSSTLYYLDFRGYQVHGSCQDS